MLALRRVQLLAVTSVWMLDSELVVEKLLATVMDSQSGEELVLKKVVVSEQKLEQALVRGSVVRLGHWSACL